MMIGTAWSAEEALKRADLVGKWQCTFIDGKQGEDFSKYQMEFRADGSASMMVPVSDADPPAGRNLQNQSPRRIRPALPPEDG